MMTMRDCCALSELLSFSFPFLPSRINPHHRMAAAAGVVLESVECPPACKLPHVGMTFANGSRLIVITDDAAVESAAAVCVAVGSHWDPVEAPGLAHLCEHMLFLGTEALPEEGAFERMVSQEGGGSTNAWTTDSSTTYYFTAQRAAFAKLLSHFIQFFHAPLLSASGYEREVQAVHSEDEKNHSVDYWRLAEVIKTELRNPAHPTSRYGNGNATTLLHRPRAAGVDVCKLLRQFYETYYVAPAVTLVVWSPLTPEAIRDLVAGDMAQLRPGAVVHDSWPCSPRRNDAAGLWLNVRSVKALRQLTVMIPTRHKRFSDACRYASHVIGHECDGSLLYVLKCEGLATAVTSSAGHGVDGDHDDFTVAINLTLAGLRNVERVVDFVAQSFALLKQNSVSEEAFQELVQEGEVSFQFDHVAQPHRHCTSIADGATHFGIRRAWSGNMRISSTVDSSQRFFSEELDFTRACFILSLQDFAEAEVLGRLAAPGSLASVAFHPLATKMDETMSEFHGAPYARARVGPTLLARWASPSLVDPRLRMPSRNPFIATDFALVPLSSATVPQPITAARGDPSFGRRWFRADDRFAVPTAAVVIAFSSPEAYATPRNRFFTRVLAHMIKHSLTEMLYFAELGSLASHVAPDTNGIVISCDGPSQTLRPFLSQFLHAMFARQSTYTAADFDMFADQVRRELMSIRGEQPYQLAGEAAMLAIHAHRYDFEEVIAAAGESGAAGGGKHGSDGEEDSDSEEGLDPAAPSQPQEDEEAAEVPSPTAGNGHAVATDVSFDDFATFVASYNHRLTIDAMAGGNLTTDEAAALLQAPSDHAQRLDAQLACVGEFLPAFDTLLFPSREELQLSRGCHIEGTPPSFSSGGSPPPFGCVVTRAATNLADPNTAVMVMFHLGFNTPDLVARQDCLAAAISTDFFNQLRTVETLGYVVHCGPRRFDHVLSLAFQVQSASHGAVYLLSRIHAFLSTLEARMEAVTEEQLARIIKSQIAIREDKCKNLPEELARCWIHRNHPHGFTHLEKEIEVLRTLTRADLVATATRCVSNHAVAARCLIVIVSRDAVLPCRSDPEGPPARAPSDPISDDPFASPVAASRRPGSSSDGKQQPPRLPAFVKLSGGAATATCATLGATVVRVPLSPRVSPPTEEEAARAIQLPSYAAVEGQPPAVLDVAAFVDIKGLRQSGVCHVHQVPHC